MLSLLHKLIISFPGTPCKNFEWICYVAIYGDKEKVVLITYPDLTLNHMSCSQGLFLCPEAFSLLIHNFYIYHISPPGHELGAASMSYNDPLLSVDDLVDQVAEVLEYFGYFYIF
uniref:Uncharacterized protein n=1 Tax=Lactuca sativa TaxID=4236 RepID=A0A9R1XLD4_LACSA|nr:hypothetical protein LSAT_V11C300156230 [Lactuca sativa]